MTTESSRSMPLLAQDDLNGFGNCGEGMAIQMARDGRRILWLAHESPPKNVTAVDVTDPRKPAIVLQTDLPHHEMRSNSLDLVGDLLVVACQTSRPGMRPAGFEIFDVADPARPRSVATFDASGPASRGVHHLWFVDGSYVHLSAGAADFVPRNPKDDQCYRIVDVRNLSRPREVGRWWLPGTRDGDADPPPTRHPSFDMGFRAHNTNVYPRRPDRAYVGYIDGGAIILDISDMAHPRLISRWDYHPPFPGFTHTLLPLFERELLVVSDECTADGGTDWPKLVWVLDARDEANLVPISTCPLPPVADFAGRGGRYGAHNLHENRPAPGSWISETLVVGTFFNGGVRAFDLSDPFRPREVAVGDLARALLRVRDELLRGPPRRLRAHHQDRRVRRDQGDRRELVDRERGRPVEKLVGLRNDRDRRRREEQRVPVGLDGNDELHADGARGSSRPSHSVKAPSATSPSPATRSTVTMPQRPRNLVAVPPSISAPASAPSFASAIAATGSALPISNG